MREDQNPGPHDKAQELYERLLGNGTLRNPAPNPDGIWLWAPPAGGNRWQSHIWAPFGPDERVPEDKEDFRFNGMTYGRYGVRLCLAGPENVPYDDLRVALLTQWMSGSGGIEFLRTVQHSSLHFHSRCTCSTYWYGDMSSIIKHAGHAGWIPRERMNAILGYPLETPIR